MAKYSIEKCVSCKQRHENIDVELTEDKRGRPRVKYTCPVVGRVMSVAIKSEVAEELAAQKPRRTTVKRRPKAAASTKSNTPAKTTVVADIKRGGRMAKQLSVKIPVRDVTEVDDAAAVDIAEGLLAELGRMSRAGDPVAAAKARIEAAKGNTPQSDSEERAVGGAIARILRDVCIASGISEAEWASMYPAKGVALGESAVSDPADTAAVFGLPDPTDAFAQPRLGTVGNLLQGNLGTAGLNLLETGINSMGGGLFGGVDLDGDGTSETITTDLGVDGDAAQRSALTLLPNLIGSGG